jgi:2-alkenal reductase
VVLIVVSGPAGDAQGSGFVYDIEGRIITNNHVVEEADEIQVTFLDGTIVEATLVGTDPYSNTMTQGIVSATGRQMDAPGNYAIVDVIQTDAAINPGNSGGPLLNSEGRVVGMNTAILRETQQFSGIGFVIPSDTILREAPLIIEEGLFDHAYLGISGTDLLPEIKELMGFNESIRGALVTDIANGGPADTAGLRGGDREVSLNGFMISIGGDVVIGVEGRAVRSFYDLVVILERGYRPGDIIALTIIRDNNVMGIELELGVRPGV